eukprot:1159949-Pelagomonas_calceolata.AAC.7
MPCPASALQAALADAEQAGEEDPAEDEEDESILEGGRGSGASGRAWLSMAFGSGLEAVTAAGGRVLRCLHVHRLSRRYSMYDYVLAHASAWSCLSLSEKSAAKGKQGGAAGEACAEFQWLLRNGL